MSFTQPSKRIVSIDVLRGIIMVVMALDHARDYFSNYRGNPVDLNHVSNGIFLTRFITHYCAPIFVFLAGTSAFLSLGNRKTKKQLSFFLFTRGLWLILLEVTIIRLGWIFNLDYSFIFLQVFWAIGCSMIVLSVLIFLPLPVIAIFGLTLIIGHNTLDNIHAYTFGGKGFWWNILHEPGLVPYGKKGQLLVLYPLIPWIGVMAMGYCFGFIMQKDIKAKSRLLLYIGAATILLFVIIRSINIYGDPNQWATQPHWWRTVFSFINCEKYPPSLDYLLLTLGPAILVLYFLEKAKNRTTHFFSIFGKVPLFYYILHIFLLHAIGAVIAVASGISLAVYCSNQFFNEFTPQWGYDLLIVYVIWIFSIVILYFPCRWFMKIKMKNKSWWLSYL